MDKARALQRKIDRAKEKLASLESKKENLSVHGYWEIGFLKGQISVLEDWLDDVNETDDAAKDAAAALKKDWDWQCR